MKYLLLEGACFCHQQENFIMALGFGVCVLHLQSFGPAKINTLQDRSYVVVSHVGEVPAEVMEQYIAVNV